MPEIQELFQRLKPFYGNKLEALRKIYLMEDRDGRLEIENTLQIMESNLLGQSIDQNEPILVPPPKDKIQGPIQIGDVVYGSQKLYPFGLHIDELPSHICITGATGRGKSNICFHLIKNLLREDLKWCLFDFKRSARDLLSDPIPYNREILVFTVGRNSCPFKFNPLIPPPGIYPSSWIEKVVDIITKVQFAGLGVAALLRKALDYVYRNAGFSQPGTNQKQPTLKDAFQYLKNFKTKGREINWMSSCQRTLEALCYGEMGEILNSQNPMDLKEILEKNVIFELDSLSGTNRSFFIEAILTWFHTYRLHQGGDETLRHVTIIEEAHRLLKKTNYQSTGHDSILDIWITEARQLGEGLVILCQTPSILPTVALGNTYTTICLNLKHSSDINTMSRVLLLDNEQKDNLGRLPIGRAIVKLQGRWLNPFLVDIPLYPIKKGSVNDEMLKQFMDPYFRYSTPKSFQNDFLGQFRLSPENDKYITKDDFQDNRNQFQEVRLSEEEKRLLKDIWNYPGSGVVERYKRLKLSRRKGNKTKMMILKKGLIREIPIITKKGKVILLELTKEGYTLIKEYLGNDFQRKRTGGAIHEYWKEQVSRYYKEKGFKVIQEMPVNGGKTVDICVFNGKKKVAIEIETGKSDVIGNIKKDLKAGFDEIVSVAVDEEVFEKLEKLIDANFQGRKNVRLVCAREF